MTTKPNVLIVLSSHSQLGDTGKPTGWYLPEFAHPYYELSPFCNITVASPAGGKAPLDPASVEAFKDDAQSRTFLNNKQQLWEETKKLSDFVGKSGEFDAVFYVGGHGPLFDLVSDKDSIKIIQEFYGAGKIVSAVCHGPAVFINVTLPNSDEPLIKGQPVTGFSNSEEDAAGLSSVVPFLLETELKNKGGDFQKADQDWGVKVCVGRDGLLITGQNPASAAAVGMAVLHKLQGLSIGGRSEETERKEKEKK